MQITGIDVFIEPQDLPQETLIIAMLKPLVGKPEEEASAVFELLSLDPQRSPFPNKYSQYGHKWRGRSLTVSVTLGAKEAESK